MQHAPNIQPRLRLLAIDAATRFEAKRFYPILEHHIDRLIGHFYDHMLAFPEAAGLLGHGSLVPHLKSRQREHWLRLFSCSFDDEYVRGAMAVGEAHFTRRVPPYLYLAGCGFFHCELIRLAAATITGMEVPSLLAAVTKLITLDMDLALSAYTRESWRVLAARSGGGRDPHAGTGAVAA